MSARPFCIGPGFVVVALVGGLLLAQPTTPKKYALFVGINRYNHTELNQPKPLEYAEADVTAAAELFRKAGYEVEVISGDKATLVAIRAALEGLAKKGSDNGTVVVGFAGHGIQPDGGEEAYYCPYDAGKHVVMRDGKKVVDWNPSTLLPLTEVLTHLKTCPAGAKLVLADCCRNDPKSGRGRGVGTGLKVGDLPENTAVLLSCSRGQRAYEDKAWGGGHGAFFHHVLEGLSGKALDDGSVTADALWRHVSKSVPAAVTAVVGGGAEQKPARLIVGEVDLRIAMTEHPSGTALPPAPADLLREAAARRQINEGLLKKEEREEEFKYEIVGERKNGTRRVVKIDIGGGESMEFVRIPKGSFLMGAPTEETDPREDEKPQRRVEITRDFYLGKYEVTQAQYKAVRGTDPSPLKGGRLPVEKVSWDDATAFCTSLSGRLKRTFELPTEAEWEYACRAGTTTSFHFGSKPDQDLVHCKNLTSVEVGSYPANPWGLHDMLGNVWEWCKDYYGPYDKIPSLKDPFQSTKQSDNHRVLRGGAWSSSASDCRSTHRDHYAPDLQSFDFRTHNFGFRVCFRLD